MSKPLVLDGYCGLGGWTEGFLAEGWDAVGIDIERHDYGTGGYPARLILMDMLEVDGAEFCNVDCMVFSPPCQFFSYVAMPWSRAKNLAAEVRASKERTEKELALFNACFRIQREACEAAGRHIPMVVENVKGAQKWVGRARWAFGSFFLWGDVPALMPIPAQRRKSKVGSWDPTRANYNHDKTWEDGLKLPGNNGPHRWEDREVQRLCDAGREGIKAPGMNWSDQTQRGQDFTRLAARHICENEAKNQHGFHVQGDAESSGATPTTCTPSSAHAHQSTNGTQTHMQAGVKQAGIGGLRENGKGDSWFQDGAARHGSKSNARKAASAIIAKIPLVLAQHIARTYKPRILASK